MGEIGTGEETQKEKGDHEKRFFKLKAAKTVQGMFTFGKRIGRAREYERFELRTLISGMEDLFRSPLNHSSSPPYLSPSVSRYRTPSTYSGYTFIHLPQSPCSLDVPGLDIQPR
ncbi:hypothetical protein NQZ68_005533 [Dissostichus eleginoides]|nr:hypothetical protein NQZ68_005533 [Dissostichus eleginoides]